MTRAMRRLALVMVLLPGACAPTPDDGAPADAVRADSVRTDSVRPDTSRADSSRAGRDSQVTVTTSSQALPGGDSVIGRDSAFGPRFKIDEKGKVTPIKRP